jgi:hypothetical protein
MGAVFEGSTTTQGLGASPDTLSTVDTDQPQGLDERIEERVAEFEGRSSHSALVALQRAVEQNGTDVAKRGLIEAMALISDQAHISNEYRLPAQFISGKNEEMPILWDEYLEDFINISNRYEEPSGYEGLNIADAIMIIAGRIEHSWEKRSATRWSALRIAAIAFLASKIPLDFETQPVTMQTTTKRRFIKATSLKNMIERHGDSGYENLPADDPRVQTVLVEATRIVDAISGP